MHLVANLLPQISARLDIKIGLIEFGQGVENSGDGWDFFAIVEPDEVIAVSD